MTRLAFVLPARAGAGGSHSVMQEAGAMRALGLDARVLVNAANAPGFRDHYARFDWLEGEGFAAFGSPAELAGLLGGCAAVVATTNTSVHLLAEAWPALRGEAPRAAYYVQDYEPLFSAPGSHDHAMAVASYTAMPGMLPFAKTRWLCGVLAAAHGLEAKLVVPSIEHAIYFPAPRPPGPRRIAAMVRPATPRRAPRRTLALLGRIAAGEFGPAEAVAFGADAAELAAHGLEVPPGLRLAGPLRQGEVAALLRGCHAFLDLSDYQAFGRTAAEAIACGCLVVAPALGGSGDFVADGESGFLADTADAAAVEAALRRLLSLTDGEARAMRLAGMEAVAGYTPLRAAASEIRALGL